MAVNIIGSELQTFVIGFIGYWPQQHGRFSPGGAS